MDSLTCEIRFQEDESRQSPGRLLGVLVTYGEMASDRKEMFEVGALTFPEGGLWVNEMHSRTSPILRAMPALRGKQVVLDAPFPDTQRGRDAAAGLRSDPPLFTGLSVEFHAQKEVVRNGIRVIQRAFVPRAGLVDVPSYSGSKVEVRNKADIDRILLAARLYL